MTVQIISGQQQVANGTGIGLGARDRIGAKSQQTAGYVVCIVVVVH